MKRSIILLAVLVGAISSSFSQDAAIKTNLLYGGLTYTPNLALEVGLGQRTTLDLFGGYNPWHLNDNTKKLVHWMGQAEFRYWFCERFNGAFIGVHALGSQFNIADHEMPMLLEKDSKNFQYQGYAYGGGVSFGYQFVLARRWNLELNLGVGYARVEYDKYDCKNCGRFIESGHKDYFGPTRAGVTIAFLLGRGK